MLLNERLIDNSTESRAKAGTVQHLSDRFLGKRKEGGEISKRFDSS